MTFPISMYTRVSMVENAKDTPSLKLVDTIAALLDLKGEQLFKL